MIETPLIAPSSKDRLFLIADGSSFLTDVDAIMDALNTRHGFPKPHPSGKLFFRENSLIQTGSR
jgi:hypothetical protein